MKNKDWKEELREKWAWEKFFTPEVPNKIEAFIETLLEEERRRVVSDMIKSLVDEYLRSERYK